MPSPPTELQDTASETGTGTTFPPTASVQDDVTGVADNSLDALAAQVGTTQLNGIDSGKVCNSCVSGHH